MSKLFSKEKINKGRQQEVDFARGVSAILMIVCHVGLYLGNSADTALYCFSDIIGSEWCAPVFMALMGLSLVYSRHQSPKLLLKRGVILFVIGYALNFFRTLLPFLIFGNIDVWTQIDAFFVVDILQFAGLAFMFFALLKKIKIKSWGILIISLVMVGIGQIMMVYVCPYIDNGPISYLVNLFFPVTEWSCFPFFTWFFFPAFGLCFGELLIRCKNKNKLYGILLPISLCVVLLVYLQFYFLYPNYTDYYFGGNFYYMGIINVILTAFFICFSLSFWHFFGKLMPNFAKKYLNFLSKNINTFYIISWLVISAIIHLKSYSYLSYNALETIILMFVVIIISSLITQCYVAIKKSIDAHRNSSVSNKK